MPKPMCVTPATRPQQTIALDEKLARQNVSQKSDHKTEQDCGETPQGKRFSVDYRVSATRIEDIIKSVSELTASTGGSDVRVNVNIFYQPVFNLNTDSQLLSPKLDDILQAQTPQLTQEALKPSNVYVHDSPKAVETPLTLKFTVKEAPKIDKCAPVINTVRNAATDNGPDSRNVVANSQISTARLQKACPKPHASNQCKDVLLRKRKKIEASCNCDAQHRRALLPVGDPYFDQQVTKIKLFWRGTNSCYPFSFKKKVMKYYADTDEISVDDVVDYSQKIIVNEEVLF